MHNKRIFLMTILIVVLMVTGIPSYAAGEDEGVRDLQKSGTNTVEEKAGESAEETGGKTLEESGGSTESIESYSGSEEEAVELSGENEEMTAEDSDEEQDDQDGVEFSAEMYQTRIESGHMIHCKGMDKAWSNTRPGRFPEKGRVKIRKLDSASTEAKLVYYYGHIKNYAGSGENGIELEKALTYANGNSGNYSGKQEEKCMSMIRQAEQEGLREWDSFQAYECTVVYPKSDDESAAADKLSFIAYTCKKAQIKVGITYPSDSVSNAIRECGGDVVLLPYVNTADKASEQLKGISAMVIPGGGSVNPARYKQKNKYAYRIDDKRDASEICYLKAAVKKDLPTLGICRGSQIINVANGGTLYQDIPKQISKKQKRSKRVKHRKWHKVNVYKGTKLSSLIGSGSHRVNSYHHQSVRKLGSGMKITAKSPDGVVEATEMKGKTFIVGVQFHPETVGMMKNADGRNLFMKLVKIGYRNQQ